MAKKVKGADMEVPAKKIEKIEKMEGGPARGSKKGDQSATHRDYMGSAKKKPDANKNGVPDYAEDGVGASRGMGYTQKPGAARNTMAHTVGKVMAGPAQFDFVKKVLRTGTRALGDVGMQVLDFVRPDEAGPFGGHGKGKRYGTGNSLGDKRKAKREETSHYAESRRLTREGKTFGNLSSIFDDDGKRGQPDQTK